MLERATRERRTEQVVMRIDEYELGKVIYADCMNEVNGLPTLKDKSIDLGITDPPYNVEWNCKNTDTSKERIDSVHLYQDSKLQNDYMNWIIKIMNELERICKSLLFTCGNHNFKDWIRRKDYNILIWNDGNKQGAMKGAKLSKWEPILTHNITFPLGIIKYNNCRERGEGFIHPCPKPKGLWRIIMNTLNPTSVLDPFLGSGTTAEVAIELGIKWIGYEIEETYSIDINKRINRCSFLPKQSSLEAWQ
jgi:DNA modification methylase